MAIDPDVALVLNKINGRLDLLSHRLDKLEAAPLPTPTPPEPPTPTEVPREQLHHRPNPEHHDHGFNSRIGRGWGIYPNFHRKPDTWKKLNDYIDSIGGNWPNVLMASCSGASTHNAGGAYWGQFVGPQAYLPDLVHKIETVEIIHPLNFGRAGRGKTAAGQHEVHGELLEVAKGRDDEWHKRQAERLIEAGYPHAIIRLGNESDGMHSASTYQGNADNAKAFIDAYRHVAGVLQSVSPDFEFSWCIMSGTWGRGLAQPGYPGDDVVDYCSMDTYYRTGHALTDDESAKFHSIWKDHHQFAKSRGKRVAYSEYMSTSTQDTRWMDEFWKWHDSLGDDLAWAAVFSSGGHDGGFTYDLKEYPAIYQAWRDRFSQDRFKH